MVDVIQHLHADKRAAPRGCKRHKLSVLCDGNLTGCPMHRRALVASTLALLALPNIAASEERQKLSRIGWITATSEGAAAPFVDAFQNGLAELGYAVGRNAVIEARYGDDASDRLQSLADELLRIPVDVLLAHGPGSGVVVRRAGPVPVVYVISGDPVEAGIAQSLARPGGNATGITLMSVELNGKRLELLREFLPTLHKVAILANPLHRGEPLERLDSEQMAGRLGIAIQYLQARDTAQLEASLSAISSDSSEAIVVFPDAFMVGNRRRIIDTGMTLRIPVVSGWDSFARSGALCTYGPKLADSYRRAAYYVDRILKGTKPSDLPVERPSVFEFVVNKKTANALGLTIPQAILARADEVIE